VLPHECRYQYVSWTSVSAGEVLLEIPRNKQNETKQKTSKMINTRKLRRERGDIVCSIVKKKSI
jgi:hypothetical protein